MVLGPSSWSLEERAAAELVRASAAPMLLVWGPDRIANDAWPASLPAEDGEHTVGERRYRCTSRAITGGVLFTAIDITAEVRLAGLGDATGGEGAFRYAADASAALSSSLDYEATLQRVARLAVPRFADCCVVDVVERQGQLRRVAVAAAHPDKEALLEELRRRYEATDAPQPAGRAFRAGATVVLTFPGPIGGAERSGALSIDESCRDDDHARLVSAIGPRGAISCPMIGSRGNTVGVLTFGWYTGEWQPHPGDVAVAEDLARRAATAIDNARYFRAAEEARARLRSMFMQAPVAVAILAGPDHTFELANPRCERLLRRTDLVGKSVREAFSEPGAPILAILGRAFRTGEPYFAEALRISITTDAGTDEDSFFQFNLAPIRGAQGAIEALMVIAIDVTAEVTARRRSGEMEERLRIALDAAAMGTWEYNTATGELIWDRRARAIYGLSPDAPISTEVVGALNHPDDLVGASRSLEGALHGDEHGKLALEYRIVVAGQTRWIAAHGRVIRESGVAPRVIGTLQDITEEKKREAEHAGLLATAEFARTEAESASRTKDEFLAMLGHELRNPLAPIVTALELMKQRGDGRTREQEIMERQVQHLVRLVDDLLDISRVTRGKVDLKRAPVELADVVGKAVEIASPLLEQRGHHFEIEVQPDLRVDGDELRLAQVLANLLTNAAKYTDPGGHVMLTARSCSDGNEVEIRVKDDGIGIGPELLPRVFDLFVQGYRAPDRTGGGLGIGLALVQSLVTLHGGTAIALSDGPGAGSEFIVRLPASRLEAVPTPALGSSGPMRAARPRRILVVDDNVDAANSLAEILRAAGHEVALAYDGPSALSLVGERFTPEVALLDIGLPVMDGYELGARLRKGGSEATVLIAVTGYGQDHDRARSQRAGFAQHLVKPVLPMQVLDLVESLN